MRPSFVRSTAVAAASLIVLAAAAFAPRGDRPVPIRHPVAAAADTATFAGGCFWSMEKAFDHVPGVIDAISGFSGGTVAHPSYEQVETHTTGHAESVQVIYDPARTSYAHLLDVYWHNIDPIATDGQFCDHGPQYRTIVFVRNADQRRQAEASQRTVQAHFTRPVTTRIESAGPFYAAEEFHQKFAQKNPDYYARYRAGCGRDARLHELWGDAAGGPH